MSSGLQTVNMSMSNLNVDNAARTNPNAYSSVQETGQSQEIIREGIRAVQTVQANEAASRTQRVHRKDAGDDQEQSKQGKNSGDRYEHTKLKQEGIIVSAERVIQEGEAPKSAKKFDFFA